jgi:hypothetical protein
MQSHALGAIYCTVYGQLMHKKWCLHLDKESLSKRDCVTRWIEVSLYINGKIKAQLFRLGSDL